LRLKSLERLSKKQKPLTAENAEKLRKVRAAFVAKSDNNLVRRDKNLVPLSRQHQHALALCVRLERALKAGEVDLEAWQAEMQQMFEQEIGIHFAAEEKELFPAAARALELQPLVEELLAEHAMLRDFFSRAAAGALDSANLGRFPEKLAAHIRKEERELFEGMQRVMSAQELATVGVALERALAEASKACVLPTPPRPKP
jgi:hemerythrin-like domain-containing protein